MPPESCASCSATGIPYHPAAQYCPQTAPRTGRERQYVTLLLIDDLDGGVPSFGIGEMRTSYKARQQRQHHEDATISQSAAFCLRTRHRTGWAAALLPSCARLYLVRTPMSHLVRVSFCIDPLSGIWIPPHSGLYCGGKYTHPSKNRTAGERSRLLHDPPAMKWAHLLRLLPSPTMPQSEKNKTAGRSPAIFHETRVCSRYRVKRRWTVFVKRRLTPRGTEESGSSWPVSPNFTRNLDG